jgi:glycosyltransferase involved in cell wall biosynthesis
MRISIVIATKDRASQLERALRSFESQIGPPPFEIIVVDNGSTDETSAVTQAAIDRGIPARYVYEAEPNRGKARNAGVRVASGYLVAFCDDDVQAPPGWIAAHDAAHQQGDLVVSGPIINVASYEERPRPTFTNLSRAFFCTCNVSLPRYAFEAAGGFDEAFDLYGWEDTELGMRLRERGARRHFAWGAYIWHVKPPTENTLHVETRKAVEKARMAVRFVRKQPTPRARLAAGLHPVNILRGRYLLPDALLSIYAGAASTAWVPRPLRALARAQFLDGMYTRELVRALDE